MPPARFSDGLTGAAKNSFELQASSATTTPAEVLTLGRHPNRAASRMVHHQIQV